MTLLVLSSLLVFQAAPVLLNLDPSGSVASYTATHKLHHFTGTSHGLAGAARILADGTVQLQIRGPVGSFDSDNGNRDEHMKETVEAIKFPDFTVKCLTHVASMVDQHVVADCDLNLHGQTEKASVPVDLKFEGPAKVHAKGAFAVSWDGFGIKRPQLLFVPIEDRGDVTFDVTFVQ